MKFAKLRCKKCKYEWQDQPGSMSCPKCGHDYIEWLNYREFYVCTEKRGGKLK